MQTILLSHEEVGERAQQFYQQSILPRPSLIDVSKDVEAWSTKNAAAFALLEKNEQYRKEFLQNLSHELKTPIAITRLNLETLQKRKLDSSQQEKLFTNTLQETDRLNDLCDNILLAAQIDSGRYMPVKEDVNISTMAGQSTAFMQSRFPKRTIMNQIEPGIFIRGDQLLLHLLFNNLIENAIKYSPPNTTVRVSMEQSGGSARFSVTDEGIGIPAKEKKKIPAILLPQLHMSAQ